MMMLMIRGYFVILPPSHIPQNVVLLTDDLFVLKSLENNPKVVWSATHEVMPIICFDINTR